MLRADTRSRRAFAFPQVSVAQYFAVDYHNVYKYVTDTRGVTPRTYVLYQARPRGNRGGAQRDGCAATARAGAASRPVRRSAAQRRACCAVTRARAAVGR